MLAEYRYKVKDQFEVLGRNAQDQKEKLEAVVAGITPILKCVDLDMAVQPVGRSADQDFVVDRCTAAWENFKEYNRDAVVAAVTHALSVVRSHYPSINLQAIGAGFAEGKTEAEIQQLEVEVEDAAKKLAGDVDLFNETVGDGGAQ